MIRRYVNPTAFAITVSWCSRETHWIGTTHDASDGVPDRIEEHTISPVHELAFDDSENNGAHIESVLEASGMVAL